MKTVWMLAFVLGTGLLAADAPATRPGTDAVWQRLKDGNARFATGKPAQRDLVKDRGAVAEGQQPNVIVLGCADSRLSPELIFDASVGELFVVRTAGNIADKVALGSIEYAVSHFPVSVIVVLGHTRCGAVAATAEALTAGKAGLSDNLKAIVKQIEPALKPLHKDGASGEGLVAKGVTANARLSAASLCSRSAIVAEAIAAGKLKVVSASYDLATGVVEKVD